MMNISISVVQHTIIFDIIFTAKIKALKMQSSIFGLYINTGQ